MEPYPARIIKAYSQVDAMGLVGYWRNLTAFTLAASTLGELDKHWRYCVRVADHDNPLFKDLAKLTVERKQELQHASNQVTLGAGNT